MSKLLVVQVLILFVSFYASQNITNNTNKIPTLALTPNTIHIRVSDLPDPYHTPDIDKFAQVVTRPENATLNVPERFEVNLFKEGITAPRWLALTPTGDLLVTQTSLKQITLLRDTDNDGVADVTKIFAGPENGLNKPFGMAFHEGYFYLGNYLDVRRYPYTQGQEKLVGEGEIIIDNLPEGEHWTRNVVISPDGTKLFVSVGSDDNAAVEPAPSATVMIMNLDGSDVQTFAAGLRNPNGLKLHPVTKELYTTINERDHLGDDLVPDYFTRIRQGEFFGWPYAYLSPEKMDPRIVDSDGNSLSPELVASTITPDVLFQAHSCALGLDFYTGSTFPSSYKNGAFVALKGSYNRHTGTGYKIVFIPFGQNNRPMGSYQDFVTGFMIDPDVPTTWGRPVGVLVLPDGSLIFSDEPNGNIYRVQYNAPPSSTYGTRLSSLYALLVLLYIFISM